MDIDNTDSLTMPVMSSKVASDSRAGVELLLKHLQHACESQADKISFSVQKERLVVRYFSQGERLKEVEHSSELGKPLETAIANRLYAWPSLGDRVWETSNPKSKRLIVVQEDQLSCFAEGYVRKDYALQQTECVFSDVRWDCEEDISEIFDMTASVRGQLEKGLDAEHGLVLVNEVPEPEMGGASSVVALKSSAMLMAYDAANVDFHSIIDHAKRGWVVLVVPGNDPVDIFMNVVGAAATSGLEAVIAELTQLVFVQRRVMRTCSSCSQSGAIEASHIDQLPEGLKPSKDGSMLIGRGCESCKQTGYRGIVGVESVLVPSVKFRELAVSDGVKEKLTEIAYRTGARSLLESGVRRVEQGKTTFQALFKVVRSMSQAFAASMLSHADGEMATQKDNEIDNALASVGDQLFSDEKSAKGDAKKLLLVEDDEDQLQILRLVFEKAEYNVAIAHDGVEALEYVEKRSVDVIVCDLMMPRMNGKDFVEQVRRQPHLKDTPILILTAVESPDAEDMLLETGADDYCVKSMRRSILLKRVEKLVSRGS